MNKKSAGVPSVLIVDDDPMTRMLVVEVLEPDGFTVEEAESGAKGIEMFQRLQPDILLLDVSMPEMDGFECCERIRRLPNGERIPIVMLTGNDDDESITRAFEVGATDFASKPMRWKLLGYRIRYLLRASAVLEELARSQKSLAFAQELAHVGNWEYDAESDDGSWSPELYRILGLDATTHPSNFGALLQCIPERERSRLIDSYMGLRTGGGKYEFEHRIVRPDGSERFVIQKAEAEHDQDKIVSFRGTLQDITERKMNQARIEYLANHDALTELPNRNLLADRITHSLAQAHRGDHLVAVMLLDLDRFKFINDNFGHPVGDGLLKEVADRLKSIMRDEDTVARLGGDEFVIVLSTMASVDKIQIVAQRILDIISLPFVIEGHDLHITTSIGVSIYPEDGLNNDVLLKTADAALYSAKDGGRSGFQRYTREMGVQVEEQAELANALHDAIARNELELYYQPKVDLKNGRVSGVEALLRWRRPGGVLIPPEIFIPLAELTGLILPIGEWALREACVQAKTWHDAGYTDLTVAVNISARQFRQNNIHKLVCSALSDSGLDAKYLELELTESVILRDREKALTELRQLKELGVTLALDDFGTGYSSLSYLKDFPFDVIKIDKSFICGVANSNEEASLTKSIISLAESLHMVTVAEGVETLEELSFLNVNHCDAMQGFYFSRPLPADEVNALLGARTCLPEDNCHPPSRPIPQLVENNRKEPIDPRAGSSA
jgi:diguanylate cyclase (GGDEF)-like protein/PAS domain S-box-containing protein